MLTAEIKLYIEKSVLCWLATSSADNFPNVSPKEIFRPFKDESIIIANIASPQSVKNIRQNEKVCLSFIDVFVQKGYQLKGIAKIITEKDDNFAEMKSQLEVMTNGAFPFSSITQIFVEKVKQIVAPSYLLFPERTEEMQVRAAKKAYGVG